MKNNENEQRLNIYFRCVLDDIFDKLVANTNLETLIDNDIKINYIETKKDMYSGEEKQVFMIERLVGGRDDDI